jgi:hypothetical protein
MLCLRPVANAAHAASSSARAREERGRARGGAARAMRRGRVCQARRGSGVAAQPARPRAVQRALGKTRRLGRARRRKQQRRRGRGRPREAHAAAHPIAPVDVPSKADQPRELRLLAVHSGLPHGLAHRVANRGLGTGAAHLFCAVVASSAGGAREWPTSCLTRNRSESQAPEAPKVRSMPRGRFDGHRPGSRVGREGQRARPTRASANTSTQ